MKRFTYIIVAGALALAGATACNRTQPQSTDKVVTYGSFCSSPGSTAKTSSGTKVTCTKVAGKNQYTWR